METETEEIETGNLENDSKGFKSKKFIFIGIILIVLVLVIFFVLNGLFGGEDFYECEDIACFNNRLDTCQPTILSVERDDGTKMEYSSALLLEDCSIIQKIISSEGVEEYRKTCQFPLDMKDKFFAMGMPEGDVVCRFGSGLDE